MVDTEEYFPRGGKKPTSTYFKQNENFLGGVQKGERKKKKLKRKTEDDDGYLSEELVQEVDQSYKICGIWFSYKVIKEGQLLLGRVWKVQETKVHVTLPCRMLGVVMACHISEAYNKMLEAFVNDQIEKVKELPEMFRPGQYVVVKVLEVESSRLLLSMMPQHVHSARTQADLHKGALLQAAVSSVEDHGYVMDIGIPNTRAFLPRDSANPEVQLDTGMLTWATIKSLAVESGVITLSSQLETLQKAVQRKPAPLLPGTALDFTVDKPLDNGIEGHVLDKTTAYIQRNHVDTVKGKKPGLGQRIRARLLYTVPPNNIPFLTMKNIFETTYPDLTQEQSLKEGDIVEEAQVIKIVGRTIYLKLGEGSIGMLSLRRVTVHEDLTDEQVLLKSYPIGSTHKVRVLCYNLSDYVYSVSDDPSVLAEKYFNLSQFSVGDVVHAKITAVAEKHLNVVLGRVKGLVQQLHMTETGIFIDPKKASNSKLPTKFRVGQEVTARVLEVAIEKQLLQLTLKPSLLEPELEVLQSYEQAAVGKAYTGVIVHIKNYLLISFFNNVMAFVPKKWVTKEPVDNLADAFHLGQIVKCTILTVNPELKKICGSLTKAPFKASDHWIGPKKRKIDEQDFFSKKQKADDSENIKEDKKKQKEISHIETKEIDDVEPQEPRKKKKRKNKESTEPPIDTNNDNVEIDTVEKPPKKKKKNKKQDVNNSTDNADTETIEPVKVKDSKKKKVKKEQELNVKPKEDSESDAIEIDIYEDSDKVLTTQDWSFIDLTDCLTAKQYKKRIVALQKCMKERADRIESIEKNISCIEEKGLDAKNKKYHTAMHTEKLVIQKQTEKLSEVLKIAQEKLKEFDVETNKDSRKKDKAESTSTDKQKVEHKQNVDKLKEVKVLDSLRPAVEVPSAKDFWSLDTNVLAEKTKEEESSSSEEETEEKPKKKRKKLTVAEKAAKAREEEERIREMEKRAIESESAPRSSDQFERALLAQPNCSQLWIAYMAFHLQATEIEKARAVARKALSTINFREEGDKRNVWLALLSLEHRFGSKETQQKTLEDALQMNEPYEIHSKLLDILVDTSKPQELVSLVELMMRKYRARPAVYTACGQACFQASLRDKARQVMQKGIAALEKKEHVSLLVRFAQLERSHGDRERSEALFEQVLAIYPQRVDVCSAYVDMLVKAKDIEHVRQVMERMTSLQLPARKMKVLYKKWIEAEEKIGDATHAETVRQRALQYIDKAKF